MVAEASEQCQQAPLARAQGMSGGGRAAVMAVGQASRAEAPASYEHTGPLLALSPAVDSFVLSRLAVR